jgi:hypothetical protein
VRKDEAAKDGKEEVGREIVISRQAKLFYNTILLLKILTYYLRELRHSLVEGLILLWHYQPGGRYRLYIAIFYSVFLIL